ncbi:Kelch repeat-containing protein [Parashewanella tropica]|uniref:Kelch repeat-containing protein n=1 Tax=Parashewanella tropica TaxID=2547970 RepID=UPI0010597EF6|nr:kelch repeat-containing protein [Parashewanella tropica]
MYRLLCSLLVGLPIATLATPLPQLPEAVTNNAVAQVSDGKNSYLLSFMGLAKGKDYQDVHAKAWGLKLDGQSKWQSLPDVPHIEALAGRLAATAVGIKDKAYIFGGYTVSKDHSEISTRDNYQFDINTRRYTRIADMPVAVDDTSGFTYQDRYIYLFSGWHQTANVNLVQVYDIKSDSWAQATPLPIPATFGQAVGMVNGKIVLCDGVKIQTFTDKKRTFAPSPECVYGQIDVKDHLTIHWQNLPHFKLPHHPQPTALYRMAARGVAQSGKQGQIVFIGGSDNPYNYNGIGYNSKPSEPSQWMLRFDLAKHQWLDPIRLKQPSMDHRGLLLYKQNLIRIGGMTADQQVTNQVFIDPLY